MNPPGPGGLRRQGVIFCWSFICPCHAWKTPPARRAGFLARAAPPKTRKTQYYTVGRRRTKTPYKPHIPHSPSRTSPPAPALPLLPGKRLVLVVTVA